MKRKDAETAFEKLLEKLGKKKAASYNDVGGWELDYQPDYGGFRIEEITSATGGINFPIGGDRRDAKEFVLSVNFLIEAINSGLIISTVLGPKN